MKWIKRVFPQPTLTQVFDWLGFAGSHFLLVHHQLGVNRRGQNHPVESAQEEAEHPGANQVEQGQLAGGPGA